jgi:glycosyltransferase involved in cell wall biosynthesis
MKVSIIMPAYNEEASIGEVLEKIKSLNMEAEIIVVDDASEDKTGEVASAAGAKVITHPYNMGNGAAVKTGMRNAEGDIFLLLDADRQHPPEAIPDIIEKMKTYDMVVGARTLKSKVSAFRTFGNFILKKFAEYLSGHKIADLTSGFRAIKRDIAIEFIHLLPNGFSYPTTLTLALFRSGYFVNYHMLHSISKREKGSSKIKPFKNGFEFILLIMRLIMLFDPLRIFLPLSIIILMGGIGLLGYQIIIFNSVKGGSLLTILAGIFIFCFGLIADQNAAIRRELRK